MKTLPEITEREQSKPIKELWQMTKAEYEKLYGMPPAGATVTGGFSQHRSAVEIAVNRGCKVPDEVLADYPQFRDV